MAIFMIPNKFRCPHCKKHIRWIFVYTKTEIANPLQCCTGCGKIYLDGYRREWLNFSNAGRFLFKFHRSYNIRIALLISFFICVIAYNISILPLLFIILLPLLNFIRYLLIKNRLSEAINESLERTEVIEHVESLKQFGLEIHPIDGIAYAFRHDGQEKTEPDSEKLEKVEPDSEKLAKVEPNSEKLEKVEPE